MGVEVGVGGLSKSFCRQAIWWDVTLTVGEVSVLLGPSGIDPANARRVGAP